MDSTYLGALSAFTNAYSCLAHADHRSVCLPAGENICACKEIEYFLHDVVKEPSLYTVKAVFILDNDGNRLLSKYYDPELYPTMKEQKNFESNIFSKTHKADNEIAFLEGMTIVYKNSIDLFFYVVGSAQENELMLMSVLNCLFDSLSHVLRKNVERRCLLDNMEGVFLVVDEIIDGGVILESDPQQVLQKVNYRADDNPLTEQSVAQHLTEKLALTTNVLQSAKEQIKWSILK